MARVSPPRRLVTAKTLLAIACGVTLAALVSCNNTSPTASEGGATAGDQDGGDAAVGEASAAAGDASSDGQDVTNQPGENATSETSEEANVTSTAGDTKPDPNAVLRHAVFFAFKDEASEADIQGVVDAFRELPEKIDAIVDFQWGKNNSPEGLDDGFTHCFLLTFKDVAGRASYLPHPDHKAFGDTLRPHLKDVFVIDYWGMPGDTEVAKPLQHAVFFKFKADASEEEVQRVEQAFAELPSKIDAIKAFEWGRNNSPETHDDGFTHAFLVTFDSEEGRAAYLPHAEHQAFVELLKPSLDKPRVLDFWAEK